ncbi:MAG: gamma-glutamyltransferase [Gammaproteobacteria bacterium]|nr:gamma-glutamyltransferase [Gammaproteobacteria bacterium]MBU1554259.1 gamma-glutamyltransferase [Gammaproteobacteria bacterium]MBU2068808.1 gamma-glutamyltransferase [Gammaproteobacteria bacterium]MBU2184261.1 gamma-glutamyltransferase [Gammaproteobacteria bacterium]MBU2206153.1 gamma-glutamyltransferase [Gammaproteobacteria bacterium]
MRSFASGFYQRLLATAFITLSTSAPLSAQQETREPEAATGVYQQQLVLAKHYMVSAAHPMATQAGVNVLAKGGSAVDAAIAVQLMLGLVEPQSSGIGGGAFMLHWQAAQQQLTGFDGRETAPKSADGDLFSDNGTVMNWRDAYVGGKSVGVPGVVAMLYSAHQQHGKLAWAELFTDTIAAAEQGFQVSSRTARQLAMGWNKGVSQFYESKQYFFPDGKPVAQGSVLKNPAYAATLKALASQGPDAFYKGELAKAISERVQTAPVNPGGMTTDDLASYQVVQRDAVCIAYRVYKVCGMAPPSSGGIAVLQMLGILQQFELDKLAPGSVQATHILAQAAKLAFADRELYLADPAFVPVPVSGMLAPDYLASRAALIDLTKAGVPATAGVPKGAPALIPAASPELPNTSHFSIVDAAGNAVSMTSSIENVFGSGLMVGGFMLNNQLTDFSLTPVHNGHLVANRVQGGKRPRSSMAPMMVFDAKGQLLLVIGSPGGSRIINYVAQSIVAVLDWKLDVQQALNLPRFTHRNDYLALEKGTALAQQAAILQDMGYKVQLQDLNSGLHAIMLTEGALAGAADPRREGQAAGK